MRQAVSKWAERRKLAPCDWYNRTGMAMDCKKTEAYVSGQL